MATSIFLTKSDLCRLGEHVYYLVFCFQQHPDHSSSGQSPAAGCPARRPQRLWRVRTEEAHFIFDEHEQ